MKTYSTLKNLLMSVMSAEAGLSAEEEEAALNLSLDNLDYRRAVGKELIEAFQDDNLSWIDLVDNDNYCVFSAESENQAKAYIKERLWQKVFART